MTLDREAARALFANAEPLSPSDAGPAAAPRTATRVAPERRTIESDPTPFASDTSPFAAASPFAPSATEVRTPVRKGVDWRLVAPLGVAAVCVGAIALFAMPQVQNNAEEGRTVASTDITAPPVAPPVTPAPIAPVETAAVTPAPAMTPASPAPTVQRATTPRPAAKRAPTRQTAEREAPAAAPSASDPASSSYASVTVPAVAPPSLGAPVTVTPTPAPQPMPATPPVAEPQ